MKPDFFLVAICLVACAWQDIQVKRARPCAEIVNNDFWDLDSSNIFKNIEWNLRVHLANPIEFRIKTCICI